jgi:hypothetical protein
MLDDNDLEYGMEIRVDGTLWDIHYDFYAGFSAADATQNFVSYPDVSRNNPECFVVVEFDAVLVGIPPKLELDQADLDPPTDVFEEPTDVFEVPTDVLEAPTDVFEAPVSN